MARRGTKAADQSVLGFRIGAEHYGVAASLVREVRRMPRVTRVPHAPNGLMGLGNFRGEILPVLSFAQLSARPSGNEQRVILLDTANPIALAVDEVSTLSTDTTVRRIDAEAIAASDFGGGAKPKARVATTQHLPTATVDADVPLVVFFVAGQEFALPIGAVQEILPLPDAIALLPHADDVAIGSISVRDVLLPLLSLQVLLALPRGACERQRIVIVRIGTHRVGFVVDAMRGVIRVAESRIDPVPTVLARSAAEARIQAICRLEEGRLISVLAPEHLIREDLTARLLETATPAESPEDTVVTNATSDDREQFLIFRIGDTDFGLPIGAVIEVTQLPTKLGRLPKAPAFIQGIMTLRGTVVPVIDQTLRFTGAVAQGARRRVIVARLGEVQAGFVVDSVSEVRSIARSALNPAPELGSDETRVFDRVATSAEDARMVLIVSPQELLDRAERDLLSAINGPSAPAL